MDPARHDSLRQLIVAAATPPRSVDLVEAADCCGITVLEIDGPEALAAPLEDGSSPILRLSPGTNRLAFALVIAAAALRPGLHHWADDPVILQDPEICSLALDLLLPPPALASLNAEERTVESLSRRFRLPEPLVLLCLSHGKGPCPV